VFYGVVIKLNQAFCLAESDGLDRTLLSHSATAASGDDSRCTFGQSQLSKCLNIVNLAAGDEMELRSAGREIL
jgi:hypothetical protein